MVVALRKESVDRNIGASYGRTAKMVVALRKESVDRNSKSTLKRGGYALVALRKESVDRNINREMSLMRPYGRSPQGERG